MPLTVLAMASLQSCRGAEPRLREATGGAEAHQRPAPGEVSEIRLFQSSGVRGRGRQGGPCYADSIVFVD